MSESMFNHSTEQISKELKCCIEEVFSKVHDISSLTSDALEKLFQPCEIYHHREGSNSLLKQVFTFYLAGSNETQDEKLKVCQEFFCGGSTSHWMLLYILLLAITLLVAVLGNFFACFVILKVRSLRKCITYHFLFSLAISDLLVSLFVLPIKISNASTNRNFCNELYICRLYNTTDNTFFAASVTHLFVIAIDRFLSIIRPYDYDFFISPKRCRMTIVFIWMYSIFWGFLNNLNMSELNFKTTFVIEQFNCKRNDHIFPQILYTTVFYIPCVLMLYIYLKIWRVAVRQAKEIEKMNERISFQSSKDDISSVHHQHHHHHHFRFLRCRKIEFKATKVILTVFGTFLVCWTPITAMTLIHTFKPFTINKIVFMIFCDYLPNLNSCLNPFIYCIFHREFKSGLKSIFYRMSYVAKHEMSLKRKIEKGRKSRKCKKKEEVMSKEDAHCNYPFINGK